MPTDVEARQVRRYIAQAAGNGPQILRILDEVEVSEAYAESPSALCEVYDVAMGEIRRAAGAGAVPADYGELGVRRLQALCRADPAEARMFHRFLRHHGIGLLDSRSYLARAQLEAACGDIANALRFATEGIAANAEPSEPLRQFLLSLQQPHLPQPGEATALPATRPRGAEQAGQDDVRARCPVRPRALSYSAVDRGSACGLVGGFLSASSPALGRASSQSGRPSVLGISNLSPIVEAEADSVDHLSVDQSMEPSQSAVLLSPLPAPLSESPHASLFLEPRAITAFPQPPYVADGLPATSRSFEATLPEEPASSSRRNFVFESTLPEGATAAHVAVTDPLTAAPQRAGPEATFSVTLPERRKPAEVRVALEPFVPPVFSVAPAAAAVSAAPAAASQVGTKVVVVNGVRYERLRVLGRGGSSKVYEVRGPCGTLRALKRVNTSDAALLEAYANEVSLLRRLAGSPRVIHVVDAEVNREQGIINIVMEVGEVDLGKWLHSNANDITLGDLQALWRQMLAAVDVVHKERIIHTDLKPSNFLLVDGKLKIIDFGIANRISEETSHIMQDDKWRGTVSYMSPEALSQAEKIGRPADVWSLGIILYQIVYRHTPFSHLDPVQRIRAIPDPSFPIEYSREHWLASHSEATKAQLLDVIQRCLQRDYRRRATVAELLEHAFLMDGLWVERRAFDRTMESIAAGLFAAARGALADAFGASSDLACSAEDAAMTDGDAEEEGGLAPHEGLWQALADDAWARLAAAAPGRRDSGEVAAASEKIAPLQPLSARGAVMPESFAHFRRCLANGAKRQRLALASRLGGCLDGQASLPSSRPASVPAPLTATVPAVVSLGAPVAPTAPVARAASACMVAPRATAQQALPARPPSRTPLVVVNGNGHNPREKISASELQQRMQGLKKVGQLRTAAPGKENAGGFGRGHGASAAQEVNPVLMRLKSLREQEGHEDTGGMTEVTRWAVSSGA